MDDLIQTKIDELVSLVKQHAPTTATSFRLFQNCENYSAEYEFRTANQLRKAGISMRNLKGEFIK